MGPSFDDVPASAAPNKQVAASYAYADHDRSTSPIRSDRNNNRTSASVASPPRANQDNWWQDDEMNGHYTHDSNTDLPRLQARGHLDASEEDSYRPISADDDPNSYDLVGPGEMEEAQRKTWNLEKQSQALFSKEHLQVIFGDPSHLLKFTSFLGLHRPQSVPILVHYLDSLKALRALHYANAILEGLDEVPGLDFTKGAVDTTVNAALMKRANDAFDYLVREELPAYVTFEYIRVVSASITARITGMLAPHLREASEGLAEVFCLTDPSRPDNPIVFASEEFNRTTQYGMNYILGRNCRFLQGPFTNPLSVRRLRDAVVAGRQHQEVFLNYRRDGSPFMNLLMTAPLCDSRGSIRYYIGAQVDVSGLVKDCAEMESLARLMDMQANGEPILDHQKPNPEKNDELRELSEMLNQNELTTIHRFGGRMHKENDYQDADDAMGGSTVSTQGRLLIKDPNALTPPFDFNDRFLQHEHITSRGSAAGSTTSEISPSLSATISGRLSGIYSHYLLIRPYPSLRILFASPSLRIPGILQSPFMNKIGGSNRVREELTAALADGRGVTAKVRWISKHDDDGRNKWIHCTPLVGVNGQIGVWMVIIVDDERHRIQRERGGGPAATGGRVAPPVAADLRGRATPDRHNPADPTKTGQQGSTTSQRVALNSRGMPVNQRYGYSAGERPMNLPDGSRAPSMDGVGSGSVQSFRI
ncbi:hypothetical protein LTS08_000363 [Lithohypha guttulata]|nr:hypothetical protein LTR51_006728 [Lithohypha guttulata]KAK5106245.1 hypothetical protein LTS08_000363 [Lithohypha guttulata]